MNVTIGDRVIGDQAPCFIIAEIGVNHNGDVAIARRLIEAAAKAGADAVKSQKRSIGDMLIREQLERPYSGDNSYGATYGEHRAALELPDSAWPELRDLSSSLGMEFFASPWDQPSADFLEDLGVPAYKIASADLTNTPLLRHVAMKGKPVILSTGMSDLDEMDTAVAAITEINPQLVVLHCVSTYPFDDDLANLRMIPTLKARYPQTVIGYSGHEKSGHVVSLAAAVLGATVIERHFTLDRTMRGPDHAASLEPHGFAFVVENVRKVEAAMGTGVKTVLESEMVARARLGKSVVARCEIPAGTVITAEMLTSKSPGTGIKPSSTESLCGRVAMTTVPEDTLLPTEALTWPWARTKEAAGG